MPLFGNADPDLDLEGHARSASKQDQTEAPNNSLPTWRRYTIVFAVSWMTLAATFASTSILSAMPEIATDMSTTVETISMTNAGLLFAMGCSWLVWGPVTSSTGRIPAYNAAVLVLLVSCIGTAVSKTLLGFTITRVIGGLTGTAFQITGQGIVADIFDEGVRGTAVGIFLSGSVIGPALGPCIGGIIVTYASWRVIYWMQTGMAGIGLAFSLWVVRGIHDPLSRSDDGPRTTTNSNSLAALFGTLLSRLNPLGTLRFLLLPNIFLAILACCLLVVFQYSLLTTVRLTINPRFNFTSPLNSGLFYIAPGMGFLLGTIIGGWISDRTVNHYITKRHNVRLAQDRLRSCLPNLLLAFPTATLIYGWTLQKHVGGLAIAIISGFCGGLCLMAAFAALNTYLGEAVPSHRSPILAEKFVLQYSFAAASNAAAVPLINAVGVGLTFTICAICLMASGLLVFVVASWGSDMERAGMKAFPGLFKGVDLCQQV